MLRTEMGNLSWIKLLIIQGKWGTGGGNLVIGPKRAQRNRWETFKFRGRGPCHSHRQIFSAGNFAIGPVIAYGPCNLVAEI